MRLHRLEMTAIGPFAGTVTIDFTKVGQQGLFLLEGPTGSGKSTVIDAVSFALYGRVAQASADNERLRSHHVAPDVVPVVDLVFETQSGIYRIRRTPQYLRPKKKAGGGLTKQQATIKMWRLTSPDDPATGEPLSTSFREADDEVLRAVGLSHSQFVQTMVLPQGEFATFLKSDTDDKRKLLQRLFGTEIVARTQAALIEGRREAFSQRETAEKNVDRAMHGFLAAAGLSAEAAAVLVAAPVDDALDLAASHVAELKKTHASAQKAARLAAAVLKKSRGAYDAALELASRRSRRDAFRARADALAAARPTHDSQRSELDAAERAAVVRPAATALTHALAAAETSARVADEARSRLPADLAEATEAELEAAGAARQHDLGVLAEFVRLERELPQLSAAVESLDSALGDIASTLSAAQARAVELPTQVAALRAERDVSLGLAAELPALEAEVVRAGARLKAALAAVEAERVAKHDEQITMAALSTLESHEQRLSVLRTQYRASIAADLGLALQIGEACQVCGSVEHPEPARPGSDYVSKEQVDRAESERVRLSAQLEDARSHLEAQRLKLRELQTAADQDPPETAAERLADVEGRAAAARAAANRASECAAELAELDQLQSALSAAITQAEVRHAELSEQRKAASARLQAGRADVERHRGGHASVADHAEALGREAKLLLMAREAVTAVRVAREQSASCADVFRAALAEGRFDTERAWLDAVRTSVQMAQLRAAVKAADDEAAAVRDGLADPALNDPALDEPAADLEALLASVEQAESAWTESERELATAHERLDSATRHSELLAAAVADGRQVLADTAAAIRLGNLVSGNGDNRLKMELTTYVLVRRFTEVIASANAQLRNICDSRYELEHTESRNGNARSGLGLQVHDHFTGISRDPKTLSGGEAFYVALSLALGLADVVRSESGGVDMGTLFIDEGFGSLDPDTLDDVMGVLDRLRAGGRVVGIVSHVQELKTRISDRIEVIPRADKSSVLRVIA